MKTKLDKLREKRVTLRARLDAKKDAVEKLYAELDRVDVQVDAAEQALLKKDYWEPDPPNC